MIHVLVHVILLDVHLGSLVFDMSTYRQMIIIYALLYPEKERYYFLLRIKNLKLNLLKILRFFHHT